jgi:predicted RNA-binding Zn ribbon-like protein
MPEPTRQCSSVRRMRPRTFLAVRDVQLVGGRLCLDFVNSTGDRSSGTPRERLKTYRDLLIWSRRVGILSAAEERRLNRKAALRVTESEAALQSLRSAREHLYQVFCAFIDDKSPPDDSLVQLNRMWRKGERRRELMFDGHAYTFASKPEPSRLDAMLWAIVSSAIALLTSSDMTYVRRCEECDWLFLDQSKNRLRVWCKKECGDRVRARRHYTQVRQRRRTR